MARRSTITRPGTVAEYQGEDEWPVPGELGGVTYGETVTLGAGADDGAGEPAPMESSSQAASSTETDDRGSSVAQ